MNTFHQIKTAQLYKAVITQQTDALIYQESPSIYLSAFGTPQPAVWCQRKQLGRVVFKPSFSAIIDRFLSNYNFQLNINSSEFILWFSDPISHSTEEVAVAPKDSPHLVKLLIHAIQ